MKRELLTYQQMLKYGTGKRKKITYRLRRDHREVIKYKFVRTKDGIYQVSGRQGCCGGRKVVLTPVSFLHLDKTKTYDVLFLVI